MGNLHQGSCCCCESGSEIPVTSENFNDKIKYGLHHPDMEMYPVLDVIEATNSRDPRTNPSSATNSRESIESGLSRVREHARTRGEPAFYEVADSLYAHDYMDPALDVVEPPGETRSAESTMAAALKPVQTLPPAHVEKRPTACDSATGSAPTLKALGKTATAAMHEEMQSLQEAFPIKHELSIAQSLRQNHACESSNSTEARKTFFNDLRMRDALILEPGTTTFDARGIAQKDGIVASPLMKDGRTVASPQKGRKVECPEEKTVNTPPNFAGLEMVFTAEGKEKKVRAFYKPLGVLFERKETVQVKAYRKGSYAKELGIEIGWTLVSIDGEDMTNRGSYEEAMKSLQRHMNKLPDAALTG